MARQLSDGDIFPSTRNRESTAQRRRRLSKPDADIGPPMPRAERAALYLRVSGEKSVESNLSIPDQQEQLEKFCESKGWVVVEIYVEPGVSAKSTTRSAFRRLMVDAQAEVKPFDKILVHNTSRFARSSSDYLRCEQILHELDIEVLAVSQTFTKDVGGWMAKRVTTLFDEYHSKRSAVDSIRARRKMVMQGYWPGSPPPYGYKLIPADENAQRKVLALAADESRLVEMIFSFVRCGDGNSAPMGVKAIAKWLNDRGFRTRNGARWSVQAIHRMLTNSVYYGVYYWGVSAQETDYQELQIVPQYVV